MSIEDIYTDSDGIHCNDDFEELTVPNNFKDYTTQVVGIYFDNLPYREAKSKLSNDIKIEIACRKNAQLKYKKAMEKINNLESELKAIKNKEEIVEITKGDKIITFNRKTNKITWRYWYADLDYDIIEELIKNELMNYYKTTVIRIPEYCPFDRIGYNERMEKEARRRSTSYKLEFSNNRNDINTNHGGTYKSGYRCWGYTTKGDCCKVKYCDSGFLRYKSDVVNESIVYKHLDGLGYQKRNTNTWVTSLGFTLCKRCEKRYSKKGNMIDEWAKDEGYAVNTSGYLIKTSGYCVRV
jgi:hypothetical protein